MRPVGDLIAYVAPWAHLDKMSWLLSEERPVQAFQDRRFLCVVEGRLGLRMLFQDFRRRGLQP